MINHFEHFAGKISARSRARKWAQFQALMYPGPDDRLIDVGVNTIEYSEADNYLERHYDYPQQITAVGLETDFTAFKHRYPLVKTLTGNGTKLPFSDDAFDIAYSNAVIEHVGGYDRQLAFMRELYRIAGRGYLTTPNRRFPIEVHTRIPLLHLILSKPAFGSFLKVIGKSWAAGDYMHLLSADDLRKLAAEAGVSNYMLIPNRLCGLTMTYTFVWNKRP